MIPSSDAMEVHAKMGLKWGGIKLDRATGGTVFIGVIRVIGAIGVVDRGLWPQDPSVYP
jgi:hypothetical protein